MDYKDYYKILGVNKNASDKEIKTAYRAMARKYHPDMNKDDKKSEERFKEINEAYEVLSDADKRHKYDTLGANWNRWQQTGGNASNFDWSQFMGGAGGGPRVNVRYGGDEFGDLFGGGMGGGNSFSEFFTSIFGGMGGAPTPNPGRPAPPDTSHDIEHGLEISLTEAYHGTSRVVTKDGRRLEVKIPAGAKTGTKVRVRGEGSKTFGGKAGDLYLKVKVSDDPRFERDGNDLLTDVHIDLYTAILGGEALVPTISGEVKLKIPTGVQNGQKMRLRGKGMPKLKTPTEHGDLYARLNVQLPKKLSARQIELFEKMRDLED
jgi:curved DNA-binding protein